MRTNIKLCLLTALVASILSFGNFAYCASDKKSSAEVKTALKERLASGVKKMDNGDVVIVFPPADPNKINSRDIVGPLLKMFISYVDPEMDFENLEKNINREIGSKKGKEKKSFPISKFMMGISKGLARNNMQLQKVGFSANNVIAKLDEGVPLVAWVADSNVYQNEIWPRTQKRASTNNMADWAKELRKLEVRKIERGHMFSQSLIMGYNKVTDEFLLFGVFEKPIWVTEKEVKKILLEAYQLRY